MTKQMTKIAMMLVLAIGILASAATAQKLNGSSIGPASVFDGVETAKGTFESMSAMCRGNAYVLNSFGEWESYHLAISVDYLNSGINPFGGYSVTGGTWSLVVVRDNQYAGTLYGEVSGGAILLVQNENGETTGKQVQVNLLSTGGLGIFKGKKGENIGGVYSATTDINSKETSGSASFNF